jgi:beta-carotene 3-hydroxylase
MKIPVKIALGILIAFPAMEAIAWAMHKWIMHGPLWILHRSHHRVREKAGTSGTRDRAKGRWEANDAFGIFFSGVSMTLIWSGLAGRPFRFGLGLGMALYGLAYLWVHDAASHGRFGKFPLPRLAYLRRLIRDHRLHHSGDGLDGSRNFGFLWPSRSAVAKSKGN